MNRTDRIARITELEKMEEGVYAKFEFGCTEAQSELDEINAELGALKEEETLARIAELESQADKIAFSPDTRDPGEIESMLEEINAKIDELWNEIENMPF